MPGAHVASKSLKDGESFYQITSEFGGVGRRSTFRHIDCFADPSRRVSKGFVCRIVSFCSKTKRSKKMIIYGSIWPYTDTYPYRSQHFFNLMLKKNHIEMSTYGGIYGQFFCSADCSRNASKFDYLPLLERVSRPRLKKEHSGTHRMF